MCSTNVHVVGCGGGKAGTGDADGFADVEGFAWVPAELQLFMVMPVGNEFAFTLPTVISKNRVASSDARNMLFDGLCGFIKL
jgi:hypothetical protein